MYEFFKSSDFFNFELMRILGSTPYSGCDAAEFLDAVSTIKNNDGESWYRAWIKQAEKAEKLAEEALASGHAEFARNAFLRACNYYRASQYMVFDEGRKVGMMERSVGCFEKAMPFMEGEVRKVGVPFEGVVLPGYLYLPPARKRVAGKMPIIIVCNGADSTKEELHFISGASAPAQGYAVLTVDGPGQGMSLLKDKTRQRPDWEVVVSAILDFVEEFAGKNQEVELDVGRIAIMGATMGGYYALRGAADKRIKACVAMDAFYDMWDLVMDRMPKGFMNLWLKGWVPDSFIDSMTALQGKLIFQSKWEVWCSSNFLGLAKPTDVMRKVQEYTFRMPGGEDYLYRVRCPVLTSGAAFSIYFKPELSVGKISECLKNVKESEKEIWIAKEPADGGLQAKAGAWPLMQWRTLRFLDKHLGVERECKIC
jgi:pimeloyl-ACP methyl ester carboxylesterase